MRVQKSNHIHKLRCLLQGKEDEGSDLTAYKQATVAYRRKLERESVRDRAEITGRHSGQHMWLVGRF